MQINAQATRTPNGPFEPFSYEKEVGPLDVLVAVKYCSLTGGDLCFIDNLWGDTVYPLVPGSEIFGVVSGVGGEVKELKVGDFVGLGYQMSSCLVCDYCRQGQEQFCQNQHVLQINGFGGLADHIISDSRFVFKIPDRLQTPIYVPLLCSGLAPYSAIKASELKSGMKIGLVGVGNLGHLALQILMEMGCHVTVFSHSRTKEKFLRQLGAADFKISTDREVLQQESGKYDFIFSTSSGNLDWPLFIKALKPDGTLVFIGLPAQNISFPASLLADYSRKKIVGSYIGSRLEMAEFLDFANVNSIKPAVEIFPMSSANEVLAKLREKSILFSAVLENK
jgi:D-arabinose 1-dehydrogenase-like Zn-dependent alcohol dehydrogenase